MKKMGSVLCLLFVILFVACKDKQQQVDNNAMQQIEEPKVWVKEIGSEEFLAKVLDVSSYKEGQPLTFKGDKPVVVDFSAEWCGPCKRQAPILEKIARQYEGKIDVYKVDIDKTKDIARFFNISSIPTLLFVPKGGDLFFYTGLTSQEELQEAVETMLPIEKQDTIQQSI